MSRRYTDNTWISSALFFTLRAPLKLISVSALAACILLFGSLAKASSWEYDFGTDTGTFVQENTVSEDFLPQPQENGGTARVRVGTGGGGFYLENPGIAGLGDGAELRIKAPTGGSVNKFSIYERFPGKTFYTKFKLKLGDSDGGGTAEDGRIIFMQGAGGRYSDNLVIAHDQTFTGLRWDFGGGGVITTSHASGGSWSELGGDPFVQGSTFTVEIYGNNTLAEQGYSRNGSDYSLGAGTYDLWVNDTLVGDNLPKGEMESDAFIDSFLFYGVNSSENQANIFLDDFEYTNALDPDAPQLFPELVYYNLDDPGDITANIIWNEADSVVSVSDNGDTLNVGTDYEVVGDTLTIKNDYLDDTLKVAGSSVTLKVEFDESSELKLDIMAAASLPSGENWVENWDFDGPWEGTAASGNPEHWVWGKRGERSTDTAKVLVGEASFVHEPYLGYEYLEQTGKLLTNKEYHLAVYAKGTGMVRPGIIHSGGTSYVGPAGRLIIEDSDWERVDFSYESPGSIFDGGISIGLQRKEARGEELVLGAVWFSDTPPPGDWPSPPQPVDDLAASSTDSVQGAALEWTVPFTPHPPDSYELRYATYSVAVSTYSDWWDSIPESEGLYEGRRIIEATEPEGGTESHIIDGLYPNLTYWFAVKVFDEEGYSSEIDYNARNEASQASAEIINLAPLPPTGLTVPEITLDPVEVKWDPNEEVDVSRYLLYRAERDEAGPVPSVEGVFIATVSATSYNDTGIDTSKYYTYWVRALDDFGLKSPLSAPAQTSPDLDPPVIGHTPLTDRALGRDRIFVEFSVSDNREVYEAGIIFQALPDGAETDIPFSFTPSDYVEGEVEIDKSSIGPGGFRYRIYASDGPNLSFYPGEDEWITLQLRADADPEQRFVTPSNPEVVFGTDAESVLITDTRGNEVFKASRGGSDFIVWNPAENGSIAIESGLYIYRVKTQNGYSYGTVVIVK